MPLDTNRIDKLVAAEVDIIAVVETIAEIEIDCEVLTSGTEEEKENIVADSMYFITEMQLKPTE